MKTYVLSANLSKNIILTNCYGEILQSWDLFDEKFMQKDVDWNYIISFCKDFLNETDSILIKSVAIKAYYSRKDFQLEKEQKTKQKP